MPTATPLTIENDNDDGSKTHVLRELQQLLLRAVTSSSDKGSAIGRIAAAVVDITGPAAMVYMQRDDSGGWAPARLLSGNRESLTPLVHEHLPTWADNASRHGSIQITAIEQPAGGIAVTAPVLLKATPPEAFIAVYPSADRPIDQLLTVYQLIATHITMWQILFDAKQAKLEATTTASLIELLTSLESIADFREACYRLVNELQQHVGCQRVVVGMRVARRSHCHVCAISGVARFEQHSEMARAMEAALDEALVRGKLTVWPPRDESERPGGLAHEKLRATAAAGCVVSSPLRDDDGEILGAWLFIGDTKFAQQAAKLNYIEAAALPIGARLRLLQRAARSRPVRLLLRWSNAVRDRRQTFIAAAILMLVAILCAPFPHRIACHCTIEPVVRRYVVAPYDGILKTSRVETGEIVSKDQVLAVMDGREILWELAGLDAEYSRARKERDSTLADAEVAAAQRASIEMRRVDLRRELLQHRSRNLEIKSPIDGIVVSGDLKKVEGAPLTVGQSLYEVAPLNQLVVEVAISETDINHVREGAPVVIRLEAFPWQTWNSTVSRIWPRSEIRDDANVFIAEVELANASSQLRPGMSGRAKIKGRRHPLAWILFHKPIEALLLWIGW